MQTFRWLPASEADARDVLARSAGRMQRQGAAIARDQVSRVGHAADLHFNSFQ